MTSLTAEYLDRIKLSESNGASLAALGAYRGRQELFRRQTPQLLTALRDAAAVESTESSNRIEGVIASRERIESLVLHNSLPRDRSEQEIAGYRDALNLVHESALEMTFSVNVILQLHTILYRHYGGRGGKWKMTRNEIVESGTDGVKRVRFAPPEPVMTPQLMETLATNYLRAVDVGREPLIIIPLAILDFLCIHPFSDGNGRTGRILTPMLLYQNGFDVGRYISLERIIEESKETYYEALQRSSQGWHEGSHDPIPWLGYFWGVLLVAYQEFEKRVGTIRTGRGAKTDIVEEAVARRIGAFSISDIEAESPGVSRDWIRMVLRKMREDGRIGPIGKGRGSKWIVRSS